MMQESKMPFTEDDMKRIFNTNLADVAREMGFNLVSDDRNAFRVIGQDMGGLFIFKHGRGWWQGSTEERGNIIDFVMKFGNMSKIKAMEHILKSEAYAHCQIPITQKIPVPKKPFELPPKAESFKQMFGYLIGSRKIDKEIIYHCVKNKLLYQSKKKLPDGNAVYNCAFVCYDKDNIAKHCYLRSTNSFSSFGGDVEGGDKSIGFSLPGTGNKLMVFEAAIDALSGATMIKRIFGESWSDFHYLSQNSVGNISALEKYLNNHAEIDDVYICYDNNKAGHIGYERIKDLLLSKNLVITRCTSLSDDMNDDLKNGTNIFRKIFHVPSCSNSIISLMDDYEDFEI